MDDLAIARALHVLGVVVWIGGVAMVTAVILPATQRRELGADPVAAFSAIERRFGHWARGAVLLVWLVFTYILFVAEPFYLHRRFDAWAAQHPEAALAWLARGHWILLTASLLTVLGAVAGSHGVSFF